MHKIHHNFIKEKCNNSIDFSYTINMSKESAYTSLNIQKVFPEWELNLRK